MEIHDRVINETLAHKMNDLLVKRMSFFDMIHYYIEEGDYDSAHETVAKLKTLITNRRNLAKIISCSPCNAAEKEKIETEEVVCRVLDELLAENCCTPRLYLKDVKDE